MKIGIVGNYGHRNLGDEALLLGAIECARIGAGLRDADIVVLSDNQADTAERLRDFDCEVRQLRRPFGGRKLALPMIVLDVVRALKGIDYIVFGGGGLLNDSNRTAIPMFVLISVCARIRGIRTAWWSVGIGPLGPGIRWHLARWLLRSSAFVTVRDEASAELARNLTGDHLAVTPDLAHALTLETDRAHNRSKTVAVSVIPYRKAGKWFETEPADYSAYCDKIVEVIGALLRTRADVEVVLFPVSLDQDAASISDIRDRFEGEPRLRATSPKTVDRLFTELRSADVVIGTRLHSVVLGTLARVPVVTIAYQPKVQSYAEELGIGFPSYTIDKFEADKVVTASLNLLDDVGESSALLGRLNDARYNKLMETMKKWRATTTLSL